MSFPLYLIIHVVYGGLMAFIMERRLRSEGEVLGVPLVASLVPVAFVSAPIGAMLVRWSGNWFLHGAFQAGGAYTFERYQLGIMIVVAFLAGVATIFGLFISIAFLSRDARIAAATPFIISAIAIGATGFLAGSQIWRVSAERVVWMHPVGALSLVLVVAMALALVLARRHLSAPLQKNP